MIAQVLSLEFFGKCLELVLDLFAFISPLSAKDESYENISEER